MEQAKKYRSVIKGIEPDSPAALAGLAPGDELISINGGIIRDVIDFQLLAAEERLDIEFSRGDEARGVSIHSDGDGRLGIYFETSVFDRVKTCRNHCVFCFVDQLPPHPRQALRVKDDDFRLSFLYGNFVTLTNLERADIDRVIEQRLSPLYVSLHSTDQRVREKLLRPPRPDRTLENLAGLLAGGIEVHIQIVACPGINDGPELDRTLRSLRADFNGVASVGIVPVGLTGHRDGLTVLRPFTPAEAAALLDQVAVCQKSAAGEYGYNWVYAADEFYLAAGRALPEEAEYDDFPQIENGIGLTRRFIDEVGDTLKKLNSDGDTLGNRPQRCPPLTQDKDGTPWWPNKVSRSGVSSSGSDPTPVTLVTGQLGAHILGSLAPALRESAGIELRVIEAASKWLGGQVSVAALLAGADIVDAVRKARATGPVLVPSHCLNADRLFLDDMTLDQVEEATGAEIVPVPPTGHDLMAALLADRSACA